MKTLTTLKPRTLRLKLFLARVKHTAFILSIWTLGVLAGTSWLVAGYYWNNLTGTRSIIIENAQAAPDARPTHDAITPTRKVGTFTAYTAGDEYTPGVIMANGERVHVGAIACPSRFALGDKILINGTEYICKDRMAKRFRDTDTFDIYMNTRSEALQFGKQSLEFTELKK